MTDPKPKCLETRRQGSHLTTRRYRKANGRDVRTMEIPWTLWLRVRCSVMKGMPGFEVTEAARDRIALVKSMMAAGEKSDYVAAVTGLTPARVRQIYPRTRRKK